LAIADTVENPVQLSRLSIAAALLTLGGSLAGAAALAIGVARLAVEAGFAPRSIDRLLLDDLTAILPFILAFVVVDLAIALGIIGRRSWAVASASILAFGVVALGSFGFGLILLGSDLLQGGTDRGAAVNGLGIVGAFTAIYLVSLIALQLDATSSATPRSIHRPHPEGAS
jgi:hypothetical protein